MCIRMGIASSSRKYIYIVVCRGLFQTQQRPREGQGGRELAELCPRGKLGAPAAVAHKDEAAAGETVGEGGRAPWPRRYLWR